MSDKKYVHSLSIFEGIYRNSIFTQESLSNVRFLVAIDATSANFHSRQKLDRKLSFMYDHLHLSGFLRIYNVNIIISTFHEPQLIWSAVEKFVNKNDIQT